MGKLAVRARAGILHEHKLVRMEDDPDNDGGGRQGEGKGDMTTKINPQLGTCMHAWQPTPHKLEVLGTLGSG